ncbi:hypothetical protein MNBD_ALPHA12-1538 [hydrothermal vent metagenome]|uniref:phosphoglycerate mutase (2,3-diphosphoglycerate-dependent) n=1 Tax=hydrothermal vent metagenome TaxID=652676 RepID=A0A3B0TWR3_9ZZZZ
MNDKMTDWPEIFFARHGETEWNRQRRYQGTMDIPLNDAGRAQALASGPLLKQMLAQHNIDPAGIGWYVSPLGRAVETMNLMRAAFDGELPEVTMDKRLAEISFGALEGKLQKELPPELALPPGEREADYWFHRPPDGENYSDLGRRVLPFLHELNGTSIIVAHGGIMRLLRHLLENVSHKDAVNWFPPQGCVARFADHEMHLRCAGALPG